MLLWIYRIRLSSLMVARKSLKAAHLKYRIIKWCLKPIWGEEERLLLEAKNISVYYGTVKALEDVSFNVNHGEIVAMIGPNGAGKSTALKAMFGLVDIDSGDILFNGESIKSLRPG